MSTSSTVTPRVASVPQSSIAKQLAQLLLDAGIPQRKQRSHVARTLGVSYPAALRRLTGESPWADNEIHALLASIDHEWDGLAVRAAGLPRKTVQRPLARAAQPGVVGDGLILAHTGEIMIAGLPVLCDVFTEATPASVPPACDSLCLHTDSHGAVSVVRSSTVSNRVGLGTIARIEVRPTYASTGPRLAILDQNQSVVEALSLQLSTAGFRAEGFGTGDALLRRLRPGSRVGDVNNSPFDAYLIDWQMRVSGSSRPASLIHRIRQASSTCAIVVMSDHFDSGSEEDFLQLSQQYKFTMLPKSSPLVVIVQSLMLSLQSMK
jgi:CheY-like chemotaxis protein